MMNNFAEIQRVTNKQLGNQVEVFDTTNTEFLKRIVPIRGVLEALGYNQPDDHILFSPFDTISRHFLLVNSIGEIQGAISAIEVAHAKKEVLGNYGIEFDPGKTIMLARFAINPNVSSGKISFAGPRFLSAVFKKLSDEGYDYVFGEMSPPYQTPTDTDSQSGVVHHHLRIKNSMLISAFPYRERVPTMVTGIPLSIAGLTAQEKWACHSHKRTLLAPIEQIMREVNPHRRRHAWDMVHKLVN